MKAYELINELYKDNIQFKELIEKYINLGLIRPFNENEWDKIKSQNFIPYSEQVKEFIDMFEFGYNIGNCVGISYQLSYSYDDVDIVSGVLPILKGTRNAEKEGGHCWLETKDKIIDTSLMLVIDKSIKDIIGYIEEERVTKDDLSRREMYQVRKEFVNDSQIKKSANK